MTTSSLPSATTSSLYHHIGDNAEIEPRLSALVTEITASTLSADAMANAFDAGLDSLATILRAVPIHEGRLLERGISLIAATNPDLVVLTENLRLPVTPAALQLVEKNAAHLVRALTLDADTGGRKSYTPDLLIHNRQTRIAHVVDVKRSLSSYEVSRIAELMNRMLAGAMTVADLLYREHRRLIAEEVRVVIINAESQRSDIEGGIWPLGNLDHLLEVTGAGDAMLALRRMFQEQVAANWVAARQRLIGSGKTVLSATLACDADTKPTQAPDPLGLPAAEDMQEPGHERQPVRIGFARIPTVASRSG